MQPSVNPSAEFPPHAQDNRGGRREFTVRATQVAVVALFFLSGATGLIYEILWTRQLSLIFGVTAYAVAIVLATFMGGLALGSFVFGRWSDRFARPLVAYAILELAIGLYALVVPALLDTTRSAYVLLHGVQLPSVLALTGRIFLAGLVLLPPTVLMGGTFPILMRHWVRASDRVGLGSGVLYFVNTSGAVVGCLFCGFWALEHLGLRGTAHLAAAINGIIGIAALSLCRRLPPVSTPAPVPHSVVSTAGVTSNLVHGILACIAISGFTSLAYEVLWTRALLRYLYNSTYAFTTTLATFLAGIAAGSVLYVLLLRHLRNRVSVFVSLQLAVGIAFALSGILFMHIPEFAALLRGTSKVGSFEDSVYRMFLLSAQTLLLPTLLLGALFPLATELCTRELSRLGHSIGRVYAVNTVGAILGSLAATFLLIPLVGMQGTLYFLILLNGVAALTVTLASEGRRRNQVVFVVMFGLLVVSMVMVPKKLFIRTFLRADETLAFYEEGATDTVGVVELAGQRIIRYDDLRGTAGTLTVRFNYFLGHLPMLLHAGGPARVLHICFGVGNSLAAVAVHDNLIRVDNVELSPHVIDAADYFWTNDGVLHHPKVKTIIDDGRNYLLTTTETYDVILMEPPETFTAGIVGLYTTEFYREALAHLADDGVMMQWIPAGGGTLDEERMLFRAFSDVFPHATAWRQLNSGCILLIGTKAPLAIDYQALSKRMQQPAIAADMQLSGIRDVDHLLSFFLFDETGFAEFVRGSVPITDDRTVVDFSIPRSIGSGFGLGTFNMNVEFAGRQPWKQAKERGQWYLDHQNSVIPLLHNLGADTAEAVGARITASQELKIPGALIPEAEWQRAPASSGGT